MKASVSYLYVKHPGKLTLTFTFVYCACHVATATATEDGLMGAGLIHVVGLQEVAFLK